MHIKTFAVSAAFAFAALAAVSAQNARIEEIVGTVEIRPAGSGTWQAARTGQEITPNTMISTGFQSSALLALGNSRLTVRSLTRLSLEEILRQENTERVGLSLQAGRIRAEVTPPPGGRSDFSVRSPSATASVRGTDFDFDTTNLSVRKGAVLFRGAESSAPQIVEAGHHSSVENGSRASRPLDGLVEGLRPAIPGGAEMTGYGVGSTRADIEGAITITITGFGH